jgi:recombination protein RecR
MDLINKLTKMFRGFPGIGERQAKRFVYHLLGEDEKKLQELAETILLLKKDISQCESCFRFSASRSKTCDLCLKTKDEKVLIVVEKDANLEVFRRADFAGKFFVLGGEIPLLEKELPKNIKLPELLEKLKKEDLNEVVLAFSLTPAGEYTEEVVRKAVGEVAEKNKIKISTLGRGLSSGLELEYSDSATLTSALKNRN